jgi:nucleoside 2-deoxyribosyltransferase
MKIYIAAMYSRREEMDRKANLLKHKGFEITSSWIYSSGEGLSLSDIALVDLADIDRADAIVSFTNEIGTITGGRHVEFGYGLAKGKRLILIGGRENIFHYHPSVEQYSTLDAWLERETEPT